MRYVFATVLSLLATPLFAAEDRLTTDEFAALVGGKTLFFSQRGEAFGVEEYRRDRTVIWMFLDREGQSQSQCLRGIWEPGPDDTICFTYQAQPDAPLCWTFFRDGEDTKARVVDANPEDDLTVIGESTAPVECPGPDVGV